MLSGRPDTRARQSTAARVAAVPRNPSLNHRWNHSPAQPPRFMLAWQRRVAAFFGQER
ncbi:MAG: hypothetical protein QOC94_2440 [Actinoplanes sp.]|jgi:hypothetical protein|nr:hypothetical protein [Pseudonocardiales bacterium]MDT5032269.1 hypothetical protein [Actinoplanes sp.]